MACRVFVAISGVAQVSLPASSAMAEIISVKKLLVAAVRTATATKTHIDTGDAQAKLNLWHLVAETKFSISVLPISNKGPPGVGVSRCSARGWLPIYSRRQWCSWCAIISLRAPARPALHRLIRHGDGTMFMNSIHTHEVICRVSAHTTIATARFQLPVRVCVCAFFTVTACVCVCVCHMSQLPAVSQ